MVHPVKARSSRPNIAQDPANTEPNVRHKTATPVAYRLLSRMHLPIYPRGTHRPRRELAEDLLNPESRGESECAYRPARRAAVFLFQESPGQNGRSDYAPIFHRARPGAAGAAPAERPKTPAAPA